MSRFVARLEALTARGEPLDLAGTAAFAHDVAEALEVEQAEVDVQFPWFRTVRAPVSGLASRLESQITFRATTGPLPTLELGVQVTAKAVCPCSKAISDRGAHNQRSDLTLRLELDPDGVAPSIDAMLGLLERSASSPVYPLLKREDEKFVTEAAYDQPVFVEDIVRRAADALVKIPRMRGFTVEAVNRESIHAHDCYARIVWRP